MESRDTLFATTKPLRKLHQALYADVVRTFGQPIGRLVNDSRRVTPGSVFAAYPGEVSDGRKYIPAAVAAGASGVLWEAQDFVWQDDWQVKNMPVENLAMHLGELADAVYNHPSQRLWMIGITGTNGKTSCSFWLAQTLAALNIKTALIGTLGNGFVDALNVSGNTTPDPIVLHESLATYVAAGAHAVAMEVSSHGLVQDRVEAVAFDFAVFTNLTRDHLDYHDTMEVYGAAKARLFDTSDLSYAIVNSDDEFGKSLTQRLASRALECITYGIESGDIRARDIVLENRAVTFSVVSRWGEFNVRAPVVGRFNVYNLLAVITVLLVANIEPSAIAAALKTIRLVPGRMQRVDSDRGPTVIIDYAHTPDALKKALLSLREIATGRVICVFGCGGNRDRGKRPLMGAVVDRLADVRVVTSDNPREEAPATIISDIIAGMRGECSVIEDREQAVRQTIGAANASDIILIAGKGHENYQEIAGQRLPFSDKAIAEESLARWSAAQ